MARKQTPKQTPPADTAAIDQQVATIDAERARLEGKLPELAVALTAQQAALVAAEERHGALTYERDINGRLGIDDEIVAAQDEADRAARACRVIERNTAEVHRALRRLHAERQQALTLRGLALVQAVSPACIAEAERLETLATDMAATWLRLRDLRIQQTQAAADAELPETLTARLHNFRALERRIAWVLGTAGIGDRPLAARAMQDVTCGAMERALQAGDEPVRITEQAENEAA